MLSLTLWLIVNIQSHGIPHHYYFCRHYRKSVRFLDAVNKLQSCKKAQGLTLQSFLVLPMQRITRLPLLVNVSTYCCHLLDLLTGHVGFVFISQTQISTCRLRQNFLQLQQLLFKVRLGTKRVRKWLKMRKRVLLFSRVVPLLEITIVQDGIFEQVFYFLFTGYLSSLWTW